MGRKIPAKKHHGVKDPEKQAERRNAKIKLKINEAPFNIDDQEIPKKLKNLFQKKKFKKVKLIDDEPVPKVKGDKSEVNKFKPQRPIKKIPDFKRLPGETDKDLLWRTELTTRDYMKKARFEAKYDVDVETNEKTGEVDIKKRKKKLIEDSIKIDPKNKWQKKKLKKLEKLEQERDERKKLKKEKFKMRKLYKKNKGKKQDDFSVLKQDKVEFGDVAEQPPTLTAKPRKSTAMLKPGTRDLLLKNLEGNDNTPPSSNLSGKRKHLSGLDRLKLETERERVVEIYRKMQALKNANNA